MTWYVIDGMDGSGKSTAGDLVASKLEAKGRKVRLVTHPNSGCIWGRIELKFLHKDGVPATAVTTLLYITDVVTSLFKAKFHRKEYDDLVFVRYIMAVSYLPESTLIKGYHLISKILPMPDVKIFVDIDAETAMSRIEARSEDREAFETVEKLAKVRRKMNILAETYDWYVVDNSGTPENTVKQIDSVLAEEGVL